MEEKRNTLEKQLKYLRKCGFEQVSIIQVLQWMAEFKRENRLKRFERSNARKNGA